MLVRLATAKDAGELGTFLREEWAKAGPGAPGFAGVTESLIGEVSSKAFLRSRIKDPKNRIFLAFEGDKILGFCSTRSSDSRISELSGIMVAEAERGKGVGRELLRRVRDELLLVGCDRVIVKTETSNARALRFYQSLGFRRVGEERETVDKTQVEIVIMETQLGP